jgi:nucleoid DNA-binding protein
MEELVNLVVKKTGLPKETAQMVVKIVLDFLKKKLPPTVGVAIDGFLNNKGQAAAAASLLGGLVTATQKPAKKKK